MDPELQALQAELASLQDALAQSANIPTQEQPSGYGLKQLAFDIPTGVARAGAGLADVLSYPVVKGLEYAGAPVETFGLSKLLGAGAEAAGTKLGVAPETKVQDLISFITPSPLSKAKLLGQAGTGLAAYLGSEAGQAIAPESPYASLVGALAGPTAVSKVAKAASAIAPSLEDVGMGLQRKARGARASDYKLAKNAIIETVEGDTTTQLKKSFDNLIEKGTLGKSIDPESMYPKLQAAKEGLESEIQKVLTGVEAKTGPIPPPKFDNTLDYISKNIAANEVDKYLNEVIGLQDAIRREGKGSLVYLNQQKKVIGESWKNSPQSDPGFWRTLYKDVKGQIEKYAPEVKDLNKQKQDLIVVSPIIERGFKASGASYDIGKVQQLLNTTGGAGLAGGAILGAAAGNAGTGILGALTLRALSTPKGQNLVGRSLTKLGKALAPGATSDDIAKAATSLMSKEEFAKAQPFVHGTNEAGLKAADIAYERLLKTNPKALAKITPEELQMLPENTKQKLLQSGYIASKTIQNALASPQEKELLMASEAVDPELADLQAELQSLQEMASPTKSTESVKIGKQNISLPTGDKYAPASLVKAVMQVESSGKQGAVSPKGATGLMQLMPGTARDLGVDATDAQQNVEGGSRYLRQMLDKYGDQKLALAAYNWGPGNVDRAIKKLRAEGLKISYENVAKVVKIPSETRNYVNRVIQLA